MHTVLCLDFKKKTYIKFISVCVLLALLILNFQMYFETFQTYGKAAKRVQWIWIFHFLNHFAMFQAMVCMNLIPNQGTAWPSVTQRRARVSSPQCSCSEITQVYLTLRTCPSLWQFPWDALRQQIHPQDRDGKRGPSKGQLDTYPPRAHLWERDLSCLFKKQREAGFSGRWAWSLPLPPGPSGPGWEQTVQLKFNHFISDNWPFG